MENSRQTLLELAESQGIRASYSCRTGDCHSCVYSPITGRVTYDPIPDDAPREDQILIYCAKPDGDIVIDL